MSLSALALALTLLHLGCASTRGGNASSVKGTGSLDRAVSEAVNAYRAEKDLPPLTWSPALAKAALEHSRRMASGEISVGHEGFNARFQELRSSLRLSGMGENVATVLPAPGQAELAQRAVSQWASSAQHNRNMLGDFQLSGVGAVLGSDGKTYLTQIFGKTP